MRVREEYQSRSCFLLPVRLALCTRSREVVSTLAEELQVPGVAVGLLHDGEEHHAFHGVTSVEHPLPVDEQTLFLCGSTTKTFTATALMRLVEQGLVDLEAPVRTYLPDFRVADEEAASSVTVVQLLNHTAGWDGDFFKNTGEGDDALARNVAAMAELPQLTRPGEVVSYNNASFAIAGRLVEAVAEVPYEEAVRTFLLDPLDLQDTLFHSRLMMTRRFATGHQRLQDGGTTVMPFGLPRGGNPEGGLATTTRDLVAWARFHIEGDASVLSSELTSLMQRADSSRPRLVDGRRRRSLLAPRRRRRTVGRRSRRRDAGPALAVQDGSRAGLRARLSYELRSDRSGVQRAADAVGLGDGARVSDSRAGDRAPRGR